MSRFFAFLGETVFCLACCPRTVSMCSKEAQSAFFDLFRLLEVTPIFGVKSSCDTHVNEKFSEYDKNTIKTYIHLFGA